MERRTELSRRQGKDHRLNCFPRVEAKLASITALHIKVRPLVWWKEGDSTSHVV